LLDSSSMAATLGAAGRSPSVGGQQSTYASLLALREFAFGETVGRNGGEVRVERRTTARSREELAGEDAPTGGTNHATGPTARHFRRVELQKGVRQVNRSRASRRPLPIEHDGTGFREQNVVRLEIEVQQRRAGA
jgi:hypothetical protein